MEKIIIDSSSMKRRVFVLNTQQYFKVTRYSRKITGSPGERHKTKLCLNKKNSARNIHKLLNTSYTQTQTLSNCCNIFVCATIAWAPIRCPKGLNNWVYMIVRLQIKLTLLKNTAKTR